MATDLTQLRPRRQRFIALYLLYGHERGGPMRAYREAGYKWEGCNNPDAQLSKLLHDPNVASAIAAAQGEAAERFQISQDRVLRELALIAFSDIKHYSMNVENGELEVAEDADLSPAVTRAIQSVEYTTTTDGDRVTRKMKVKLWDKNSGLTLLMKYLGMLVDRSVNINMDTKLTMEQARKVIQDAHRPSSAEELEFAWQRAGKLTSSDIAEEAHDTGPETTMQVELP